MKNFSYLVLVIAFLIFLVSVTGFFLSRAVIQEEVFYASVNVTRSDAGFDLNQSALTFGNVLKGGSSTRNIIFENNYDFPVVVNIVVEGDIKELLKFEERVFLDPGESGKIPFNVVTDENTVERFYSGVVRFYIRPD